MREYLIALGIVLGCVVVPAGAKEAPEWRSWPGGDRFSGMVGAFRASLSTKIAVDSSNGLVGTELDLESDLGLDGFKSTPLLSLNWRMAKKHRLSFDYFRLDRSGQDSTDVAIRIGDTVFEGNVPLQVGLDISVYELSYAYSVFFRERHNLAIGAGLSIQDLEFSVSGKGELQEIDLSESVSVPAPLPTLLLNYNFAILKKLLLDVSIGWLAVSLDSGDNSDDKFWDFDGSIWNNSISLNYKAFKHVGFIFSYQRFSVDLEVDNQDRRTSLEYVYQGPAFGIEGYF